ncbi:hypothetical protein QNA08_08605 [Chelatococcus sp. SYSU_G07232]|uniref:Uncharacterized protein n=1 Tax=Chelatococcus albus TaxID=3047466 RepID=A0ABT7AI70_9HYPH|nr:hypothetical protein [Chelatococcus sp. SYSU_G07232]MDJ1158291.1 hypothetical protein [Chelatococcus sp. SYSU_G07232]
MVSILISALVTVPVARFPSFGGALPEEAQRTSRLAVGDGRPALHGPDGPADV